jgi:hypothetical protein
MENSLGAFYGTETVVSDADGNDHHFFDAMSIAGHQFCKEQELTKKSLKRARPKVSYCVGFKVFKKGGKKQSFVGHFVVCDKNNTVSLVSPNHFTYIHGPPQLEKNAALRQEARRLYTELLGHLPVETKQSTSHARLTTPPVSSTPAHSTPVQSQKKRLGSPAKPPPGKKSQQSAQDKATKPRKASPWNFFLKHFSTELGHLSFVERSKQLSQVISPGFLP